MDGYTTVKYRSRLPQLTVIKHAQPKAATICPCERALILFNNGQLYQSEFKRRDYDVEITIFSTLSIWLHGRLGVSSIPIRQEVNYNEDKCHGLSAQKVFQAEPWRN